MPSLLDGDDHPGYAETHDEAEPGRAISRLQEEAWEVANKSYHVPDGTPYLDLGRALYRQDLHRRIEELFAELDEQNARLDALLNAETNRS